MTGKSKTRTPEPRGISPVLLLEQVKNTAAWALDATESGQVPSAAILSRATSVAENWRAQREPLAYLRFLLAAHYTTVATFVPTDVDTRIREHVWSEMPREQLPEAVSIVEDVATWDIRPVSRRYIDIDGVLLSGHRGEWFSVMAGALGRALALDHQETVQRTSAWIDAELARQASQLALAFASGDAQMLLSACTAVAHNLGDLSRVVDTWKPKFQRCELGAKYHRLGFQHESAHADVFLRATEINKDRMALENHRFLTLRIPRALRRAHALLLPIGPYFFAWGKVVGATPLMDDDERAEVLSALLLMHARRTEERGCLRALAGMNQTVSGGIVKLAKRLPAKEQQLVHLGGVTAALRQKEADFLSEFHAGVFPRKKK